MGSVSKTILIESRLETLELRKSEKVKENGNLMNFRFRFVQSNLRIFSIDSYFRNCHFNRMSVFNC